MHKASAQNGKLRNDERKPVKFCSIPSAPNFEFWLLLHFEDVRVWHHRDVVYKKLKNHIPEYLKNAHDTYSKTEHLLGIASERAARLRHSFSAFAGNEPYTNADKLVEFLRSFKQ